KDYLKSAGHSEKFIQDVCYLIKNHANRKLKNKSIELQILQDVDYLADTGISGCFRPFLGWVGKKMSIIEIIKWRLGIKVKNSRLDTDNINLSISKKIMKNHLDIENDFYKKVGPLIKSELLK
ncbi:MAG: hypothetical protein PHN56_00660, partial [Candidatus Nanoarchaeia archaeon]|nr:hypothetical protein [Candidatus Nanoarchaeia archaeon]